MPMRRLALVPTEPPEQSEAEGPSLRVALATRDGRQMNAHFGSARRFVVYDVTPSAKRLVETISFEEVSDQSGEHTKQGDDRNGQKIEALSGVELLVVQAIGGPVAARVIRAQIHPVKMSEPESIESVLGKVQAMLTGEQPVWLRKVLQKKQRQGRSMDFLDDDDL